MAVSRRSVLIAASAAAVGVPMAAQAASPPGDVVGKITVGYQGWFACAGDGAPINGWWHWSHNWSQPPSPSNNAIKAWPDMRDYTRAYPTAYSNLGNGQPATLFSNYDQQTVDTHFRWMQQNGCDTAALQRFNPFSAEGPTRDAMAAKVRSAAEATGRKFYIMYDVSGWANMQSEIKNDWTSKMAAHVASSAYARQNGKPVVGIWGFGFNDENHTWSASSCLDVVNWFKAQGCYVMGGVPTHWRNGTSDSRPGYLDVYHAFHMLSPWMVGRIGNAGDSDWFYNNVNVPDQADCNAHGIDYQPCVLPGDIAERQRAHGDFMWRQFYNMIRVGAQGIYISMFDEYNEGNQIAKTAETQAMIPAGSGLLALDEDGVACTSDYYLRLTADGGKMLKGQIPLTSVRPTQPSTGQPPTGNLALNKPTSASTSNSGYASANAVDGNPGSYWESVNNAFPQWIQVDLGAAANVDKVILKLPPGWGSRTQTLSVLGSTDGASWSTLSAATGRLFAPDTTITFAATSARYVRIQITANTGWPAAQLSELEVYASGGTPPQPPNPNLALNRPTAESSHTQGYTSANTVDGNTGSYWESANNAFPQWIQADLGASTSVSRVVLKLPSGWGSRTQTLSIQGSNDGSDWSTLSAATGRLFAPDTTITFPAASARYVRVHITANTGWPAGQLSELEVYAT